ncbi:MAG TPA: hypothetical protein VIK89_04940, partial [Cytophagaceae bacterium]
MALLLQITAIALLIFIFYQDYKYRAVYWFLFPLLALTFLLYNLNMAGWQEVGNNMLINLGFISTQLALLTLYFSLKYRRLVNISDSLLGLGDILFLLVLGVLFSPLNFIVYYLLSLLIVLLVAVLLRISGRELGKIPLAGIQAILLSMV